MDLWGLIPTYLQCYPGRSGEVVGIPHFPIHIFLNVEGNVRDGATERARLGIFNLNKPRSLKDRPRLSQGKVWWGGANSVVPRSDAVVPMPTEPAERRGAGQHRTSWSLVDCD